VAPSVFGNNANGAIQLTNMLDIAMIQEYKQTSEGQ
jgi:hypothetical protein